ncbi:hypothetical protein HUU62_01410 [Rhodoferax sp. 4810]|nr:hypothetical protein [Rhodoferax jenense]
MVTAAVYPLAYDLLIYRTPLHFNTEGQVTPTLAALVGITRRRRVVDDQVNCPPAAVNFLAVGGRVKIPFTSGSMRSLIQQQRTFLLPNCDFGHVWLFCHTKLGAMY